MPYLGRELIFANFDLDRAGAPFEDRVAAADAGGFDGIGLNVGEYARLIDAGYTDRDLAAILDDHGQRIIELEVLHRWGLLHQPDPRTAEFERLMVHVGETFRPRHAQVIGPYDGTVDEAADAFGRLCDLAAGAELALAIEFLPFTNIATIGDALDIINRAGRPNAGLCVDVWHHVRGANDWEALAGLDARQVVTIQVNDGPLTPVLADYYEDCVSNRLPPGDGEFDLLQFFETLDATATKAPISVEVISRELWRRPAIEIGRLLGEATRAVLERVHGGVQRAETPT